MRKLWKWLLVSPLVFGMMLVLGVTAVAGEIPASSEIIEPLLPVNAAVKAENNSEENPIAQVNSVSGLSDVQATDWAFQALQSFVERYGCIAGYPNGTYRGNRAMTRYEFAAGLNACLNRVNELIGTATGNLVTKQDLATIQRLQNALRGQNLPVSSNSYGFEASFQLSPKFVLGGWVGYTNERTLSTLGGAIPRGDLDIWNYAVTLAFPDLGKKGSVGGIKWYPT